MIETIYDEANALAKAEFLVIEGVPATDAYLTEKQKKAYNTSIGMTPKDFRTAIKQIPDEADDTKSELIAYLNTTYGNDTKTKRALYEAKAPSSWNNPY